MTNNFSVALKIRKFTKSVTTPEIIEKTMELDGSEGYNHLKAKLREICGLKVGVDQVLKLRRHDEVLVPFSFLLEPDEEHKFFYLDVCPVNYENKATATFLQDAYIDSVHNKLKTMESRIEKAETLLPQLEWRRQAHLEETVGHLSSKVSFLNRRIDELLPAQWRSKMPQTMA